MALVIVQYTFAVFRCSVSGKHSRRSSYLGHKQFDCKDMGLISGHKLCTLWYIFSIQTRPDLCSHITKSSILSGCNGFFYCFVYCLMPPQIVNQKTKGVKRVSRMWDALRGVVYSGLQSSLNILRFI